MPNIRFEKIEKSFGSVRVLLPIDLSLDAGEFTVLVSPFGPAAGNRRPCGFWPSWKAQTPGRGYFNGSPIRHFAPKDRDIAMVFQDYALPARKHCEEHVLDHDGIVCATTPLTLSFHTMDIDDAEHD